MSLFKTTDPPVQSRIRSFLGMKAKMSTRNAAGTAPALQPVGGLDEDSLTFFAVSDFGSANDCVRKLASAMDRYASTVQAPAFILGLGDNFYPCGVLHVRDQLFEEVWRDIYLQYDSLRVPWRMALGNHDYMGNPDAQVEYTFDKQLNHDGIWQMPARSYNFIRDIRSIDAHDTMRDQLEGFVDTLDATAAAASYAEVNASVSGISSCTNRLSESSSEARAHFFAFDTNGVDGEVAGANKHLPAFLRDQIANMKHTLSASDAEWKIAFGHHCMYTAGTFHGATGIRLREESFRWSPHGRPQEGFGLENALVEAGVHAYFCGHEHVFQHIERKGMHHFMCGASGAEQRGSKGVLGAAKFEVDWRADGNEFGFVACTLTSETMTVRFINDKLQLLKEVVVQRCLEAEGKGASLASDGR